MESLTSVLIGIQARSTSVRFPGKCFEPLGNKRLLDHVIDSCKRAAIYSNKYSYRKNYTTNVALLIPLNDPIKKGFSSQVDIIEGSEYDVLSRYQKAQKKYDADYICRITGDCPLIPPYIISKHISLAIVGRYDYVSNVDESCRLSLDGIDCEVISKRMLEWLCNETKSESEREHVTIRARTHPPIWSNRAFTASFFDHSDIKLSVDTIEDLQKVRDHYERVGKKLQYAEKLYGRDSIHRF